MSEPTEPSPDFPLVYPGGATPLLLALFDRTAVTSGVGLAIHAADDMMNHFLWNYGEGQGWRMEQALSAYYRSGLLIWEHQRRILEWRFGSLDRVQSALDFAAGYGRVTRFVAHDLGPDKVWMSEIDADAVRFQKAAFGVHGFESTTEPEKLACDRRFDALFVSSLFTHLPPATFRRWLARLWQLVNPGGVLVFSVHGERLLPAGASLDADGIHFVSQSESRLLDTEQYGSTWVNEAYVRTLLGEIAPRSQAALFPRGLANFQDLWVVVDPAEGEALDFSRLDLRAPLEGFLEACRFDPPGLLAAAGWAADRESGQAPQEVQLLANGRLLASTRNLVRREEVRALFPSEPAVAVGFRLEVRWPQDLDRTASHVEIVAIDAQGRPSHLAEGTCDSLLLRSTRFDAWLTNRDHTAERERLHLQLVDQTARAQETEHHLRARISAMEASRFWKLRNAWFAVKRKLGWTTES